MNQFTDKTIQLTKTHEPESTSARRLHLINSIRVWLNRAITHAESRNVDKAESAARSALEVLVALEKTCL